MGHQQVETPAVTPEPPLEEQPHGGALYRGGVPGNKGGRPPNEFKQKMRELASREDVEAYFERCLQGEFGPKFYLAARQSAIEQGYGKAVQAVELGARDGEPLSLTVEFVDAPRPAAD